MKHHVMGIDPGLRGAIAILGQDGVLLESMPTIGNELDLSALNKIISDHASDIKVAYLEKVGAMPKQGVSSMFKFGRVYGAIEAMLAAYQIPVIDVRPQVWMKAMHAGVSGSLDPKQRSQLIFKKLFPHVDARRTVRCKGNDEGLVEATLIAEYGRRQV